MNEAQRVARELEATGLTESLLGLDLDSTRPAHTKSMETNILIDGGLKGHLARSLVVVAVVAIFLWQAQEQENQAEQLRDALASAPVQVLPAPVRLPTDYNPPKDGLMLLSEAQIAEHHARVARVQQLKADMLKSLPVQKTEKRKTAAPSPKAPARAEKPRMRWSGIRGLAAEFPELNDDSRRTP